MQIKAGDFQMRLKNLVDICSQHILECEVSNFRIENIKIQKQNTYFVVLYLVIVLLVFKNRLCCCKINYQKNCKAYKAKLFCFDYKILKHYLSH